MKYFVCIFCELGDRDNNFFSHLKFFDNEEKAIEYGRNQCYILSDYPMFSNFILYEVKE